MAAGLEEITRAIKQRLRDSVSAENPPGRLVEIRNSTGSAWDALNELRLVAPRSVVELAEKAMFHFRDRCDELEIEGASPQEMQRLVDDLLRFRKDMVNRMRADLEIED